MVVFMIRFRAPHGCGSWRGKHRVRYKCPHIRLTIDWLCRCYTVEIKGKECSKKLGTHIEEFK